MGVLLQVKDVPEDVHRTLKARAAASGMSLSEYVRRQLELAASRPTVEEMSARLAAREPVKLSTPSDVLIREIRDAAG